MPIAKRFGRISVFTLYPMPKCLTAASPSRVAMTPPSSYLQRQSFFIDVMKKNNRAMRLNDRI